MIPKPELRTVFKTLRNSLSEKRREVAALQLLSYVEKRIEPKNVLSFVSFGSEISTQLINEKLAQSRALLLPRIEGAELSVYRVLNLESQLALSPIGLLEPNPRLCEKINPSIVQTILVPALAFNESLHRLGYGKGHYDRLLQQTQGRLIGIGFIEQKTDLLVPDPWDVSLHAVIYF